MVPTLVDLLCERARPPERGGYTFLAGGTGDGLRLGFGELARRAMAIAEALRQGGVAPGERALLLYPAGLDFIAGFFGCLFAGVIAVPCSFPSRPLKRTLPRVLGILEDAGPAAGLCTAASLPYLQEIGRDWPPSSRPRWIATDQVDPRGAERWRAPELSGEALALLQYTSGSTSAPRGVMVSHANLLANCRDIDRALGHTPESVLVSWLPAFHDMGLVYGLVTPLFANIPAVLMAPEAFLQSPHRWLEAIARFQATHSVAPNFAFELCLNRIRPEVRNAFDLSSWRVACSGAEPVRQETLERFLQAFQPCGLQRRVLTPAYGLAEATLMVSSVARDDEPLALELDADALARGRVRRATAGARRQVFVGNGPPGERTEVRVVDPESRRPCRTGEVGELWVRGPGVTRGYWNQPQLTGATFHAHLDGEPGGAPFLRTGDLGFLESGQVFVTGRLKDLILIRGQNHYPQDIEQSVERCHPSLRPGRCAAFAAEGEGAEGDGLVVVVEVGRGPRRPVDAGPIFEAIQEAVGRDHGLRAQSICLIKPGTLLRTSSGKVRRRATRDAFLSGALELVGRWDAPLSRPSRTEDPRGSSRSIAQWFSTELARRLGMAEASVDPRRPFEHYGIGSAEAVEISAAAGERLGVKLEPTLLWEHPSIEQLAAHLAGAVPSPAPVRRSPAPPEPVAITGIACRFPGAPSAQAYWQLLREGRDAIAEIPATRWDWRAFYDPDPGVPGKTSTRWGGFLEGIDRFDAAFFGISPREAERMDPQQRILLELAWEALADAGLDAQALRGTPAGVFIGISASEYGRRQSADPRAIDAYYGTGNALSIAANRLSYFLDLRGPSVAIDTACSSSLVAVHLACQSLATGESELAIAGGANLLLSPEVTINFTKAGAMAADGRCKTFDARADGYVRSEGAGLVVLRPLSRALEDGDPIYAVIRGSAVNQDGRTNGLMAPSLESQQAVLRAACRRAGIDPGQVQYVEAHGTGTLLGDSIETRALGSAIGSETRRQGGKCLIGSVKSNIGHLEAAAGIAGLIKVALALHRRELPPSLHFSTPNPHIPFDELGLEVATSLRPWPSTGRPLLAGVSAFGFGGTNAHVVLSESPPPPSERARAPPATADLLLLGAHSEQALRELAGAVRSELASVMEGEDLSDLCYSAALRRSHHDVRLGAAGSGPRELGEALDAFLQGQPHPGLAAGQVRVGHGPRCAFVFSGQGSQWRGMGRALLPRWPRFREALERCDQALARHGEIRLLAELEAPPERSRLDEIDVVQPVLFGVQVALASLLVDALGLQPEAVVGHSMGEVAAAHVAGALSLDDAARVICARSRLLRRVVGQGGMLAVELDLEQAREVIAPFRDRLSVAAANGPTATVLSGERAALDKVRSLLEGRKVFARPVEVTVAAHSPQVAPLCEALRDELDGLAGRPTRLPFFSTVDAAVREGPALDAAYWARNLREPVLLHGAVERMLEAGCDVFLEVSPHPILVPALDQTLARQGPEAMAVGVVQRGREELALRTALARLYVRGQPVDWRALYPSGGRFRRLPALPWQRERFWLDAPAPAQRSADGRTSGLQPLRFESQWRPDDNRSAGPGPAGRRIANAGGQGEELAEQLRVSGAATVTGPGTTGRRVLVLADAGGRGERLAEQLRSSGAATVAVAPAVLTAGSVAGERGQLHPRAAELLQGGELFTDVVYLGASDAALSNGAPSGDESWTASQVNSAGADPDWRLTCDVPRALIRALYEARREPARLWLITTGAYAVGPAERVTAAAPIQAALWGLGQVVCHEHPELRAVRVDLGAAQDPVELERLAREILAGGTEDQVALRGGSRFVRRLVRHSRASGGLHPTRVVSDATYLVTGGLGSGGLEVARWLVGRGARHLVLTGRRAPTPQAELAIAALRAQGTQVVVRPTDLREREQLAALFSEIDASLPPLRGIVHCAAALSASTVEGGLLVSTRPEDVRTAMDAKAGGAWGLHQLSAGRPLDFFVLYSSVAAILGAPGLGAYAAANAFLDGLARHRAGLGLPALSVAWGALEGTNLIAGGREARYAQQGLEGISAREVGLALRRLLAERRSEAVVMRFDLERWAQLFPGVAGSPFLSELGAHASPRPEAAPIARPREDRRARIASAPPAERRPMIETFLQEEIARSLRVPPSRLQAGAPLTAQGIDSLLAIELRRRLEAELGLQISVASLLQGTVADLVLEVSGRLGAPGGPVEDVTGPSLVADPLRRLEPFPLTDLQQAYWIGRGEHIELGRVAAQLYLELDVDGLEPDRLARALNALVQRHDMLRAVVLPSGEQRVLGDVPPCELVQHDLSGQSPEERARALEEIRQSMEEELAPPDRWPLFRLEISRVGEHRRRLHLRLDLLVVDGQSAQRLLDELGRLYRDPQARLPAVGVTFRDYTLAARALEAQRDHQVAREYWLARLDQLPPAPELPLQHGPAERKGPPRFAVHVRHLDGARWAGLRAAAAARGLTRSAALIGCFAETLAAWARSPHFTLNLTLAQRLPLHPQIDEVVGPFTGVLLLAVDASPDASLEDRLRRLQARLATDQEHATFGGVQVIRELARRSRRPLQALMPIVFTAARTGAEPTFGIVAHSVTRTPQVSLECQVLERDGLEIRFNALEGHFAAGVVADIADAYEGLLARLATAPEAWVKVERDLVPARHLEARQALNATARPAPPELLHTPFLRRAEEQPEAPAVIAPARTIRYGELRLWADLVGRRLIDAGAGPGRICAVAMEKGWEQVVAVLGALGAGAAYLPVDPSLPDERVRHLLDHSGAMAVLTQPWLLPRMAALAGEAPALAIEPGPAGGETGPEVRRQGPGDLAYVIYTSGSTGAPKGVAVDHRAAINTVLDINERFGVTAQDRVLALSSLSFDLSVYDLFGLLAAGGAIVLPPAGSTRDPGAWADLARREQVTIWNSVPQLCELMLAHAEHRPDEVPRSLRLALLSGDWIPVALPDQLRALAPRVRVIGLGGATEAAIWSVYFPIQQVEPGWRSIPYGRPLANQQAHVLDEALEPRPVLVTGQLFISGAGLAQGYWRDPERTAQSFRTHPRTGERLYATGDLARYLPDGNLELLGREDSQVKVRGHRIELGEIEAALASLPGVRAAVAAVAGQGPGEQRVCAYVVGEVGRPLSPADLRAQLERKLPPYMVPATFIPLDALPLTSNGKVDRLGLPPPDRVPGPPGSPAGPRDRLELELRELWEAVLGVHPIGLDQGFFELGGTSVAAVRLAGRMEQQMGVRLGPEALFEHPTIGELAAMLRAHRRPIASPLVRLASRGARRPFVCVHPSGGNVVCYLDLSRRLGPEQPFYGLQSVGLDGEEEPLTCIEEMAARYVDVLRGSLPEGPSLLGGWSMGGVVAYEMARQLVASGRQVGLVVLIDSASPALGRRTLGLPTAAEVDPAVAMDWARSEGLLAPEPAGEPETPWNGRAVEVLAWNLRALQRYEPRPLDAKVLLLRARDGLIRKLGDPMLGWGGLARSLEAREVPGDHHSLLAPPAVEALAAELARALG
ncbi:MAG TPA: amino acid adenylation domain-containing protein [Myxococcaceae bacterium]